MIGSVGIAIALLGSLFVAYAALHGASGDHSLSLRSLVEHAGGFRDRGCAPGSCSCSSATERRWASLRCTRGSPTPTARRQAIVGALLAGGMTSCAFLALLRVYRIMQAAGEGAVRRRALRRPRASLHGASRRSFMVGQRDFKRMLAYSSVEHMGILVLGIGVGGVAVFGALLHVDQQRPDQGRPLPLGRQHSPRLREQDDRRRARRACAALPVSGGLFLAGFFAITGSPPFGPFVSEFTILNGAIDRGTLRRGGALPPLPRHHLHRHGRDRSGGRAGTDRRRPGRTTDYRDSFWKTAPIVAASRSS